MYRFGSGGKTVTDTTHPAAHLEAASGVGSQNRFVTLLQTSVHLFWYAVLAASGNDHVQVWSKRPIRPISTIRFVDEHYKVERGVFCQLTH